MESGGCSAGVPTRVLEVIDSEEHRGIAGEDTRATERPPITTLGAPPPTGQGSVIPALPEIGRVDDFPAIGIGFHQRLGGGVPHRAGAGIESGGNHP